jgi:long-chain fatty acid transport protein
MGWRVIHTAFIASAMVTLPFAAAFAGGLYLNEFNSPSMGVAGAGAQAVANDASTAFHNPAGMARLDGNQLMGGAGLIYGEVEFDGDADTPIPGGDGGEAAGVPAPLITGFYVHDVTDDLKLGIGLLSLTGAALDYSDDWTGRFLVQDVQLLTLSAQPVVAYRVNDWLSFGGGVGVMYAALDFDLAVPTPRRPGDGQISLDGDDVAVGFNASTLIELSPQTRLGVSYQSKIDLKFSGDLDVSPFGAEAGVDTELTLPQFIRAGVYHELNDQFALLGTVGWDDWSALDNLFISTERRSTEVPRNWKDTYHISGGIHYRPDEDWLLQAGIAFDTSPVDEDDRTPDMPIDRQIRYAIGARLHRHGRRRDRQALSQRRLQQELPRRPGLEPGLEILGFHNRPPANWASSGCPRSGDFRSVGWTMCSASWFSLTMSRQNGTSSCSDTRDMPKIKTARSPKRDGRGSYEPPNGMPDEHARALRSCRIHRCPSL